MTPKGRRTTRARTSLIRVSDRHFAVLETVAGRNRWTMKTAAEDAIERLAKDLGIEIPAAEPAVKPARRRAAA